MKKNIEHSEELRGYTIEIERDPDPTSPSEDAEDYAFLVYDHRQFTVHGPNKETARQIFDDREEWEKTHHIYPVYAYIHSGVRLGLSTAGMVDTQWDVSTTGFCLVTRDASNIPEPEKYAQGMIDEWNQYLDGDVWGYNIYDRNGADVDSCWGFYGLENCKEEARAAVPDEEAPAKTPEPITCFDDRELNTVLHALRMLQEQRRLDGPLPDGCIAAEDPHGHGGPFSCDHFDEVNPLTNEEIEALCNRMQLQPREGK